MEDGVFIGCQPMATFITPIMKVLAGNEILNNAHIVLLAD